MGELFLQQLDDFFREGGGAGGEAADAREVVLVDQGVAHEADEDGGDEEELAELVVDDCVEHVFHGEGREHVDFGVKEDGEVEAMDQAGDWVFVSLLRIGGLIWDGLLWKAGSTARIL